MDSEVWMDLFTLCCHSFNRWCHYLTFLQALPKILEHVGLENHYMDILKGRCFGHFYVFFYCSDHCIANIHSTQFSNTWEKVSYQKSGTTEGAIKCLYSWTRYGILDLYHLFLSQSWMWKMSNTGNMSAYLCQVLERKPTGFYGPRTSWRPWAWSW